MAKLDKAELEKLTPAERIKKLRKIEEENKKEIEEAEKLIIQTSMAIDPLQVSPEKKIQLLLEADAVLRRNEKVKIA